MSLGLCLRLFRTPGLLVAGGWLLGNTGLLQQLILRQSSGNRFHTFYCTSSVWLRHDCFLFLPTTFLWVPNVITFLLYLLGLFALLEIAEPLLSKRNPRWNGGWVIVGLILAAIPCLGLLDLQGPNSRLLPLRILLTALLWGFIGVNGSLGGMKRFVAAHPWIDRLLEWTFPVSDLYFYKFHRMRLGEKVGFLRYLPVLSYAGMLAIGLGMQTPVLASAVQGHPLPIEVYDPRAALLDETGFWYAQTLTTGAGIWRYDWKTKESRPVARALDLHTFYEEDGFLYFYDAFESQVVQVSTVDEKVRWELTLPSRFGSFELVGHRDGIVAVARGGYLAVIDREGHLMSERFSPRESWFPRMLADGRVAFVSPKRLSLSIVSLTPREAAGDEEIPLPIPSREAFLTRVGDEIPVLIGTDCPEGSPILYVGTLWGEIFRYHLPSQRWLTSYRLAPGVRSFAIDGQHDLAFVVNHVGGTLSLIPLSSGGRRRFVLANGFVNSVHLDPRTQTAVLSIAGPGATSIPRRGAFYRFAYSEFVDAD